MNTKLIIGIYTIGLFGSILAFISPYPQTYRAEEDQEAVYNYTYEARIYTEYNTTTTISKSINVSFDVIVRPGILSRQFYIKITNVTVKSEMPL